MPTYYWLSGCLIFFAIFYIVGNEMFSQINLTTYKSWISWCSAYNGLWGRRGGFPLFMQLEHNGDLLYENALFVSFLWIFQSSIILLHRVNHHISLTFLRFYCAFLVFCKAEIRSVVSLPSVCLSIYYVCYVFDFLLLSYLIVLIIK